MAELTTSEYKLMVTAYLERLHEAVRERDWSKVILILYQMEVNK